MRYRIRYRIVYSLKMGKTVREHPAPDKNAVMDDDDQRDYEDYNYEPPQVHDGDGGLRRQ